ncbi:LacI family transcriptional regulator [Cryptosporangium phraense]|uniref:LacI family transcriptional regulator n=1 Tax=Cryptosporangium phraense TaxID=2593070 RepID=A0A545AFS9_9ACTN|nr:LacI family transcriptional regulator [Cryptosporangium phraense]
MPQRRPRRTRRPVSIHDVADAAGVSPTTVSHVLSGRRPVNAATAARVRQAVNRMGYVPASLARSLQAGSTSVIGLLIPDITNGFYAELAKGVEDAAHHIGYSVILCNTEFDPAREDHYLDLIRGRFIDGMVYAAGTPPTEARLESLLGRFPIAVVDEDVTGLPQSLSAMADHYQGGRLAGEHLRQLGHRRAAVLTGPALLPSAAQRARGFREAFEGDVIQLEGTWLEQSGAELMLQCLDSDGFDRTAVFAANDQMALGALAVLHERGLAVPGDISLVGFDDIRVASLCAPPLTTVHQPAYDIGRTATAQLLQYVANGEEPPTSRHLLPVHLEVRASTGPAPA